MKNFQQKNDINNIMTSKIVLFFSFVIFLFFLYGVFGFMTKMQKAVKNRKIAENKLLELQKQKQNLTIQINKLNTIEGKEENIREKFGMVKEGEGVIVVVEDKNPPLVSSESSGGFWSWFTNLFK